MKRVPLGRRETVHIKPINKIPEIATGQPAIESVKSGNELNNDEELEKEPEKQESPKTVEKQVI